MVKLVFCLRRRPHLTRQEFQRYWLEVHGPLVRDRAAALGVRRYVQVHTAAVEVNEALRASRDAPEEFDGVAELWWDSVDSLVASAASEEARAAAAELLDDERRFIDHERSPIWLAEEHEIVPPA